MNAKVKIFQARDGKDSIDSLEDTINEWLNKNQNNIEIVDRQISAVPLTEYMGGGEIHQGLIVCIWFKEG